MAGMGVVEPLNENAEVRDATFSPGIRARILSSSSEIPSAKNSLSGSGLMFTKGSTATDGSPSPAGAEGGSDSIGAEVAGGPAGPVADGTPSATVAASRDGAGLSSRCPAKNQPSASTVSRPMVA